MEANDLDLELNLDDVSHWQKRAAEALEGPGAEYDSDDRQHKAAVLLMAAESVPLGAPEAVELLAGLTRYSRAFVDGILRRYRNGEVPPSAFELYDLPGPDFDVIRDVQVGLGLAYRHTLSKRLVEYDFTDTARANIAKLKKLHESGRRKDPRDVQQQPVPSFGGTIRRKRSANSFELNLGSRLIAEPNGKARWRPSEHLRFELSGMTLWLRIDRKLEKPRRYEVVLLGLTTDGGSPERLVGDLRALLCGGHPVASFVVPEKTIFERHEEEGSSDVADTQSSQQRVLA